jgi:hypothetical protein
MHRNTYLLVIFLSIFAALVVGVNIGKRMSGSTSTVAPAPTPTIEQEPTPTTAVYLNKACGFAFAYPTTLSLMDNATGSALLVHATDKNESIAVACQEEIPRPPITASNIENMVIYNETKTASLSARLYHDASAQDGTPIDELIFRNPKTGMDVFIAGFGATFDQIIDTLILVP